MFLTALLALGVMPPPPPRKEVDRSEVEALMRDLQAVGIDTLAVADLTGPEDFVVKGRLILRAHEQAKAAGEIVTDLKRLLDFALAPSDSERAIAEISNGSMPRERFVGVDLNEVEAVMRDLQAVRAHAQAVEPGIARRRAIAEVAQFFADGSVFPAERMCTHPPGCTFCNWCGFDERVKSDRDRRQQRKVKKSRRRVKSRRGF